MKRVIKGSIRVLFFIIILLLIPLFTHADEVAYQFVTKWGGEGSGDGQFNLPWDIAIDSSGNVYVVDAGNYRIQKFDSNGNFITKWGSEGSDDGQFFFPKSIAIDSSGNVYVADRGNHRIQKFTSGGTFITKWGSYGSDDGQFFSPKGIAVDSSGNVYVTDTHNYRIQKFSPIVTCSYTLSPKNYGFSPSSGMVTMSVTTPLSSCIWTPTSNDSWITIFFGHTRTGNGTVTYGVAENTTGIPRKGTIVVAGQTITIRQAGSTFTDVSENVFTAYIYSIYVEGITVGCSQNPLMYCPTEDVTRGQMAAFIIRSKFGEDFTYTTTPYYSDVPSDHVFFKYVQKMRDEGFTVVTGTYMVDSEVDRGQMAAFIIRSKFGEAFTYTTTPYYSDVPSDHVFFKYVQKMRDERITVTTAAYGVDHVMPREQMAAFLGRAFLGME